jgi:tellurite resistance protein
VPVAENDTESITPERLEKATEIIEETAELGEFEADIREESVATIDKEHEEEEEIATLLEEEKLLKRRFFILLKLL